jgi:hypothetical protein
MRVFDYSAEASRWSAVDDYFAEKLVRSHHILDAVLENNREAFYFALYGKKY